MVTITLTWHLLVVCVLQLFIIARLIYIYASDNTGGYFGGMYSFLFTIFYIIISSAMWMVYGGIVWW